MHHHNGIRTLSICVLVTSCLGLGQAGAHGFMFQPACRAMGDSNQDYQFCMMTPGCECGDFPNPGEIVATYQAGQTIEVKLEITVAHITKNVFRFQLCPPDQLSSDCFITGEFAVEEFDEVGGEHTYQIDLPPDLVCDPCVLRWRWDYSFLSCADIRIVADVMSVESGKSWAAVKSSYR